MTHTPKVTLGPEGFRVGEERIPFLAGAMHYWRVERSAWGRCLDRIVELGLPLVESYVPWSVHEVDPRGFDFGAIDRQKDLGAFIEEAAARGLRVILRPGPHINAELTYFGIPARVLAEPACQARTARDTPALQPAPPRSFPIPSYAQPAFLAEVGVWFDAFAAQVVPRLGREVIAIQVDNEMGYFFRTSAFDLDYSEGSIALFRQFLRARYKKESSMASVHGAGLRFETVEPPRRFEATTADQLPRYLDWAAYHRFYLSESLRRLRAMLEERGITGIPLFHNLPPSEPGPPFDLAQMEESLDFVGIDLYHRRQEYAVVKRRVLAAAGTSRLPCSPEIGAGGWLAWQSFTAKDNLETILAALMHGLRGLNFYMAVDRERWYGAPISHTGRSRDPLYGWLAQLVAAAREAKLYELAREAPVGILLPTEYGDLAAVTSAAAPLTPMAFELFGLSPADLAREDLFGLRHAVQVEGPQLAARWREALEALDIPYVTLAGGAAPERLAARQVLLVPTLDFLDDALAARLLAFVEAGGVAVVGPEIPDLDARLLPGAPFAEVGVQLSARRGQVVAGGRAVMLPLGRGELWRALPDAFSQPEGLREVLAALAAARALRGDIQIQGADHAIFRDETGRARVVFVASASDDPQEAQLTGALPGMLYDPIEQQTLHPAEGALRVSIPAWTVRMLVAR